MKPDQDSGADGSAPDAKSSRVSFARSLKAIGWGFLGIRKKSGQAEDFARINPLHLVAIGLLAVALLVIGLIVLVRFVVAP